MRKYILGWLLFFFLTACETNVKNLSNSETLAKLISSNSEINKNFINAFNIKTTSAPKAFKLLISRRDRFVRVTIYQIVNKNVIEDLPRGYFYYQNNLFIFYDGSEIIFDQKMKPEDLDLILSKSNIKLETSQYEFFDSQVLQFDIDLKNKIKFNFPPINPYDLTEVPANPEWQRQQGNR